MGDRRFGPYRLENLLGNGGTGQVWQAHDTRTDRTVAVKLLARELAADDVYRRRFQREARMAARLREPHVVPIHTFGEEDGQLFIDMAYVDGSDLGKLLRTRGALPPVEAVDIVSQAAAALDEAHRSGLLHRDVKPSNIIVMPSGFTYLIDFGTAQQIGQSTITGASLVIGTPAYMAPERFTGTATPRSDIYSLGCVLYESLTGRRPFPAEDAPGQMHAHLSVDPPHLTDTDPSLPAELDAAIIRALAKDPTQRFATAGEFAAAARTALTRATASATAPVPVPAAPPPTRIMAVPQPGFAEREVGAEAEPPQVAVVPPSSAARTRAETARPQRFPRRFALVTAIAAVLVGAGSGWAVWSMEHHPSPQPVTTSQPQPPPASSVPAATTQPPRDTRVETTAPANPAPAPRSSTTEAPELSTAAPQPTTTAPQPAPPSASAAPTNFPIPFPGNLTPGNLTPPGEPQPRQDTPGNDDQGNGGHDKPDKPTKTAKPPK
ncbi:serine/threonine-protein kinase [Nocardia concava]|uniref:serine/threonine-protein kinase n=1 Tax=Nocardia concava TaxID=257281 RepID=UPI0002DA0438|nr:serine/threonine-protein kinase [Nocardia concava]